MLAILELTCNAVCLRPAVSYSRGGLPCGTSDIWHLVPPPYDSGTSRKMSRCPVLVKVSGPRWQGPWYLWHRARVPSRAHGR
eukprot:scaffold34_cov124-Isochrysis_galbana.AAC.22